LQLLHLFEWNVFRNQCHSSRTSHHGFLAREEQGVDKGSSLAGNVPIGGSKPSSLRLLFYQTTESASLFLLCINTERNQLPSNAVVKFIITFTRVCHRYHLTALSTITLRLRVYPSTPGRRHLDLPDPQLSALSAAPSSAPRNPRLCETEADPRPLRSITIHPGDTLTTAHSRTRVRVELRTQRQTVLHGKHGDPGQIVAEELRVA